MSTRNAAAAVVVAGAVLVTAVAVSGVFSKRPVPPALAEANLWTPDPLTPPKPTVSKSIRPAPAQADAVSKSIFVPLPPVTMANVNLPTIAPPLITWSHEIASGETLDAVLDDAGLAPSARTEIALALGAEYDMRRLRPGHSVTLDSTTDGAPRRVELTVDRGVRIEVVFGERLSTRVVEPDTEMVTFAGEAIIDTSIFAALDEANIPARFAIDLAQMLSGTVDLQREFSGGETMRLMWRESRDGNKRIGEPELAFASLDLGDTIYELVWPDDGSGRATIFVDGEVLRVFSQPVVGARVSSVFGRRNHPVYGNVRMHKGVDFAAALGTPVRATAPGRISFIGWRSGYGRVVEIAHGSDTMTRYAHLSSVPDNLARGQRVIAEDVIGRVGATGTATGPNLHYEVLVDGQPTDPLSGEWLAETVEREAREVTVLSRLNEARRLFAEMLADENTHTSSERSDT